jgi:outer membrane protein TolC
MQLPTSLYRHIVTAVAAAALLLTGCQKYQAQPLDPAAHRSQWRARTADHETVRLFAERLAEAGHFRAAEFDPNNGLDCAEAELVALVFNPDLRIARLKAGVSAATAEHAGLWDDPTLSFDVLHITESVSNRWVVTPGLAFTIPISGRLKVEKARASAAMRAALDRVAEDEWWTRQQVRLAWLQWSATVIQYDQQQRLLESMDPLVASTSRLAESGEMLRTEAALFSIEQSQREYELRRLDGVRGEAEQRLRSLLGISPDAPIDLTPSLNIFPAEDSPADTVSERNPSLVRLRQEYEVAEKTLQREIRKQYPDLTIGPLYEEDQGQSRIGFFGSLPLAILNANKQGIAEAEAARQLARAAYETEYERLIGRMAATSLKAESLADEKSLIVTELAPLIDRQLEDARRLLELGEGGGLVLLETLVRAHDIKTHLITVRLEEARARSELIFLEGPPPANPNEESFAPADAATDEVTH